MTSLSTLTMRAALLAVAGIALSQATSVADPEGPEGHQVVYRVTTTSDLNGDIYYIEHQPASKAAYDAEPNKYLTEIRRTPIGPGSPLEYTTTLADPGWAYINASGGLRINPEFHCEILVDGEVVVSQQGGSGVTCSAGSL